MIFLQGGASARVGFTTSSRVNSRFCIVIVLGFVEPENQPLDKQDFNPVESGEHFNSLVTVDRHIRDVERLKEIH